MGKEIEYPLPSPNRKKKEQWDSKRIRALREHLGMTQCQMAEELQVRQQTISEWEVGLHTPHRSTQKVLSMVAEKAGFSYVVDSKMDTKLEEQRSDNDSQQSQEGNS